jgi:hypothetical protein
LVLALLFAQPALAEVPSAPDAPPPDCARPLMLQLERPLPVPAIVDPPRRALWLGRDGGPRNLLVPVLEIPVLHMVFWGAAKLAGKDYAQIDFSTMKRNVLEQQWTWDQDAFATNAFGHPYQGSLAFTAARSSGLGFWGSIPFAFVSSGLWELLMETERPSKNDLITTTIGGVVLGEVLHRASIVALDEGDPTPLRSILSILIEPAGGVNRYLFGRKENDFFQLAPHFGRLTLGLIQNVDNYNDLDGRRFDVPNRYELHLGLDLAYGLPGDTGYKHEKPFDFFVLNARAGISRDVYWALFIHGLIVGDSFHKGRWSGLWGLFGGYDFANPNTMRVSTVNLGPGLVSQVVLTSELILTSTLLLSGVPFGAGGGLQSPVESRDYHFGPGAQAVLDLNLVRRGVGRVGVSTRSYVLSGAFLGEGTEFIQYGLARAELQLVANHGLGLEVLVANRAAHFDASSADMRQRATQIRIYWTILKGAGFGSVPQR